jgi:hypothetical protein
MQHRRAKVRQKSHFMDEQRFLGDVDAVRAVQIEQEKERRAEQQLAVQQQQQQMMMQLFGAVLQNVGRH